MKCIRCHSELTSEEPQIYDEPQVEYFKCLMCGSRYEKSEDGDFHDRALMPWALVLYPIQFSQEPERQAERVVSNLLNDRENSVIQAIIEYIQEEISNPKQNVSRIMPVAAGESALRRYLSRVADLLAQARPLSDEGRSEI